MKSWKHYFFKTSFLLEYETAKILVEEGFEFNPDYSFSRITDAGNIKDFSADIRAIQYHPSSQRYYLPKQDNFTILGGG